MQNKIRKKDVEPNDLLYDEYEKMKFDFRCKHKGVIGTN
jgi:hypothetical protein